MGKAKEKHDNVKVPAEFRNSAAFSAAPIACYGSNEEYYEMMEELYAEAKAEFMNADACSPTYRRHASLAEGNIT